MEAASRALLIVVAVALFVNYVQGGSARVKRWAVRTLTGKDLVPPPPAPTRNPPAALVGPATPTHYVSV